MAASMLAAMCFIMRGWAVGSRGLSERAAIVLALAKEVQLKVPVSDDQVWNSWVKPWSEGSEHIDAEVQTAALEKTDAYDPMQHCPSLKTLVDAHIFNTPISLSMTIKAELDIDLFNLVMKQLKYDIEVFAVWRRKCSTVEAATLFKKQDPIICFVFVNNETLHRMCIYIFITHIYIYIYI